MPPLFPFLSLFLAALVPVAGTDVLSVSSQASRRIRSVQVSVSGRPASVVSKNACFMTVLPRSGSLVSQQCRCGQCTGWLRVEQASLSWSAPSFFLKNVFFLAVFSPRVVSEIGPFDKSFNAITGKNGSGKSNILDAIMFVFGATKAGQLRVKDFGGLVYKEGLGGVTRASVTIVFSNTDRATSPAGYEDMETFFVTRSVKHSEGTSKYMINGSVAPQAKVHALFHSVQLNIDNPTFLVQQGQITKVVNMKPAEVLAMLEEATGVRLYEDQKAKALKTLALKQSKVDQMDQILRDEITPTLEKRRAESAQYQRWVRNMQEVDRKKRLVVAYQYHQQVNMLESVDATEANLEQETLALRDSSVSLTDQMQECKDEYAELRQQKDEELGNEFGSLEKEETNLSKELVQVEAELKYQKKMASEEQENLDGLTSGLTKINGEIVLKREGQVTAVADFDALTQELQHLQQQVVSLGQRMEAAEAGVATGAGESNDSLTDQLVKAKAAQSQARTVMKQLAAQLKANKKEHDSKRKQVDADGAQADQVNQKSAQLLKEKMAIENKLKGLSFDSAKQQRLIAEREQLRARIRQLGQQMDQLLPKTQGGLAYNYNKPQGNAKFDSKMVRGRVGKLITVKDPETCTALEVVAGAKVRNVVVDTAALGKDLLQSNNGGQRTTFIPLDKIQSNPQTEKARLAQEIVGEENASLAVNLVQFDRSVAPAMDYVFGRSIICRSNEHAKKIAYNSDRRVAAHCVTYDGDVYDPSGTLTGGSRGRMGETLSHMNSLQQVEQEREAAVKRLQEVEAELRSLEDKSRQYATIKRELDLKEHELGLLKEKMQASASHQLVMRVDELAGEIERDQQLVAKAAADEESSSQRVKELDAMIKDFASTKDEQVKAMNKEMSANKKKQALIKSKLTAARNAKDTLVAEVTALEEDKAEKEAQLDICQRTLKQCEVATASALEAVTKVKTSWQEASVALAKKKVMMEKCDKELSRISARQSKIQAELANNDLKAKELDRRVQLFNKSTSAARATVDRMQNEHEWIKAESQFFGKPQTDFDFSVNDPKRAEEELNALMREQQKLEGTINKKVASMISEADTKYRDLQGRKAIVESDKAHILSTIDDCDRKKVEALEKTYDEVNASFGTLFSKFLPGATATLDKVNGSILEGLDIRVCFGGVWKESLTELSGGQRSLMALSLILALCRYKAAPLYILDEIDAALDNSHTENIGDIIGQEFSSSQFIVVSLKEGFYRNCNTLFQVELDESIQSSKVTRTARRGPKNNAVEKRKK